MESRDVLTTEDLKKKFTSQFELVNYAIRLAENMIKTGRGPRIKMDNQNRSLQVLAEISCGKDQFDEIVADVIVEEPSLLAAAREVKAVSDKKGEKKSERKSVNPGKMSDFKKERASKALLGT
jgi:hypothetical protein